MNAAKRKNSRSRPRRPVVVAVSGGFDPLHVGHVRLFEEAKALGDRLVVILNNDHWLRKKKNHVFMPQAERAELIRALRAVDEVVITSHRPNPKDMSVCRELDRLCPHIFANGGDRDRRDAARSASSLNPEHKLCAELGIRMVFGVGRGGKIQSSSWLLAKYLEKTAPKAKSAPARPGRAGRGSSQKGKR